MCMIVCEEEWVGQVPRKCRDVSNREIPESRGRERKGGGSGMCRIACQLVQDKIKIKRIPIGGVFVQNRRETNQRQEQIDLILRQVCCGLINLMIVSNIGAFYCVSHSS